MGVPKNNFTTFMQQCLLIIFLFLIIQSLLSSSGVEGKGKKRLKQNATDAAQSQKTDPKDKLEALDSNNRPPAGKTPALGATGNTQMDLKSTQESLKGENDDATGKRNVPDKKTSGGSSKENKDSDDDPKTQSKPASDAKENLGDSQSEQPYQDENDEEDDDDEEENEEEDENDDMAEIHLNHAGSNFDLQSDKTKSQLRQKDSSGSGSFMTYFIVVAVVVVILYVIVHNKKKLMAYIVEGRNTGRGRRQRATSGTEYKPLKNADEGSAGLRENV